MGQQRSSSIDVFTLVIAALASAAAAFITSQFWAGGTLFSAAMTPVIVTLVKEALAKPVERVQTLRTERHTGEAPVAEPADAPTGTAPMTIYRGGLSDKRFKVAVVTGLIAFAGVVALFTIPELVAGKSIGGGGKSGTTFFGGKPSKSEDKGSGGGSQGSGGNGASQGDRPGGGGSRSPQSTPAPQGERPTPTPTPEETATPEQTPTPTPTPTP